MPSTPRSPISNKFARIVGLFRHVSEWLEGLDGTSNPDYDDVVNLAIERDFSSYARVLTRTHSRVSGYFPNYVNREQAIARLMNGKALVEVCRLPAFSAAKLIAFERARIQREWNRSRHRINLTIRTNANFDQRQDEVSPFVALLLASTVAAFLGFPFAAISAITGSHLATIMLSAFIPTASIVCGLIVRNLQSHSFGLRLCVPGALFGGIFASMMLIPERHGGGVSILWIMYGLLLFMLAYFHRYSMPIIRIVSGLLIRPRVAWSLFNQDIRPHLLWEFSPDQSSAGKDESLYRREPSSTPRMRWLHEAESIVIDRLVQVINELLGSAGQKLLVTQDSEGLRRLNDPSLIVTTRSHEKVWRTFTQMGGGSLAIAGPRGSGKSTLLRQICTDSFQISRVFGQGNRVPPRRMAIFVSAPAEYNPKEFIIELFLQACEEYLAYHGYRPRLSRSWSLGKRRHPIRVLRGAIVVSLRAAASLSLIGLVIWSMKNTFTSPIVQAQDLGSDIRSHITSLGRELWKNDRGYSQLALGLLAFFMFPKAAIWRFLRHRRRPTAIQAARTYQRKLRQEKTTTTGIGGTLASLTFSGSAAVKDHPWTMPQLVRDLRDFLSGIAEEMTTEERPSIVIGIDEVDRIGSVEQAARFLNEIKAVFGITNCYFVVSVADDVGSIFARRAVAGRSVFENAFDDLVTVEPLSLEEARELLQRRVEGFTDPFVVLAYALSGGLPRELIRVTRRMVELKDQTNNSQINELAELLVREELYEAIEGTRTQLAQLVAEEAPGPAFILMQEVLNDLKKGSVIKPPAHAVATIDLQSACSNEEARRVLSELSAFADFSLAIIQAFEFFDLQRLHEVTEKESLGSYKRLAVARQELSVSSASARRILADFRASRGFAI